MKKRKKDTKKISLNLAIGCLIANMIIPGLGSLMGKKTKEGILQLVLLIGGTILGFLIAFIGGVAEVIGLLLMIAFPFGALIWAIKTGAQIIKEAK